MRGRNGTLVLIVLAVVGETEVVLVEIVVLRLGWLTVGWMP